jgi:hypothetical protein
LHAPDLAPTKDLLDSYKKGGMTWDNYEYEFLTSCLNGILKKILPVAN